METLDDLANKYALNTRMLKGLYLDLITPYPNRCESCGGMTCEDCVGSGKHPLIRNAPLPENHNTTPWFRLIEDISHREKESVQLMSQIDRLIREMS